MRMKKFPTLICLLFFFTILACQTLNPIEKNVVDALGATLEPDFSSNPTMPVSSNITNQDGELTKPTSKSQTIPGCDATKYLVIEVEKTLDTVNKYQTRLFEYNVQIKNNHPNITIWVLAYKHSADIWQNLDKVEWVKLIKLPSGIRDEREVYWTYYNDKDATGVTSMIFDKIAGVYDTPECAASLEDTPFLESIAYDLPFDHE